MHGDRLLNQAIGISSVIRTLIFHFSWSFMDINMGLVISSQGGDLVVSCVLILTKNLSARFFSTVLGPAS